MDFIKEFSIEMKNEKSNNDPDANRKQVLGFKHESIYWFSHINIMVKTYCTDYSFNSIKVSGAEHHILYLHMASFLCRMKPEKNKGALTK